MSAPEAAADGWILALRRCMTWALSPHDIKIETIESIGRYDSHHLKIHHFISYPELNISSARLESFYQLELVGVGSKFEEL